MAGSLSWSMLVNAQSMENVIIAGQTNPDGNGTFWNVDSGAVINGNGQIVFAGLTLGSSQSRLFSFDGSSLSQLVNAGEAPPDNNGTYWEFDQPVINSIGQVAFRSYLTGTTGGGDAGIFIADGINPVIQIVREDEPAPGGNGGLLYVLLNGIQIPGFNDNGQVAFVADINLEDGGSNFDERGVFRGDGISLIKIAREGEPAPNGDGEFSGFATAGAAINTHGQVAFTGVLANASGGNRGIFAGDGNSIWTLVRVGELAPAGDGVYTFAGALFGQVFNDLGQVAYEGRVEGTQGNPDYWGIFRSDGVDPVEIVREGNPSPDGNGIFDPFGFEDPGINNRGQVVFEARLDNTSGGFNDDLGIFLYDGDALHQIVREDDPVPNGNGNFLNFSSILISDFGQIVFQADLKNTSLGSANDRALFLWDPVDGLRELVREGDPFMGSLIAGIVFSNGSPFMGDEAVGINHSGQVAIAYSVQDGRTGYALIRFVSTIRPNSFLVSAGQYVSGDVAELGESDNEDVVARRLSSDIQSRVFLEAKSTSPTETPSEMSIFVEGAVFARTRVDESVDLFNYQTQLYEQVLTTEASRFSDQTIDVNLTGDLSRFVEPGTRCMQMRLRFISPVARQQFSAHVDQMVWRMK